MDPSREFAFLESLKKFQSGHFQYSDACKIYIEELISEEEFIQAIIEKTETFDELEIATTMAYTVIFMNISDVGRPDVFEYLLATRPETQDKFDLLLDLVLKNLPIPNDN